MAQITQVEICTNYRVYLSTELQQKKFRFDIKKDFSTTGPYREHRLHYSEVREGAEMGI